MSSIFLAVPTFENISPFTYKSIYDLDKGDNTVDFFFVTGYDCAKARNDIVDFALTSDKKYDYIFMVDSDIILPKDALTTFLQVENFDVILGAYPRKDQPSCSEIFRLTDYPDFPAKDRESMCNILNVREDRYEIKGGGFGCALMRTDIFEKLLYPWFKYQVYPNHEIFSEDLYFCKKVRSAGFKILCDSRVVCKHIGKKVV